MPFAIGDVEKHNQDVSADDKPQWVAVANAALARCKEGGGTDESCDASAIRQANAAVREAKAMLLSMAFTRVQKMADGRIRWRARANSGTKDLQGERLDLSLFQDFADNFLKVQEAVGRGETIEGMNPVNLDVAHYSFFLPQEHRAKARAGWVQKLWVDGKAFMGLGYFDTTPVGEAAAKSVMDDDDGTIRISVGFYPDWANVKTEDGVLTYRGGAGKAHLDHLAMTTVPVDPDTSIELLEAQMSQAQTLEQDALAVLGDAGLVEEIEGVRAEAKSEAVPDGAVIKAEDAESAAEEATDEEQTDAAETTEETESTETPAVAESAVTLDLLKSVVTGVADSITERLSPLQEQVKALQGQVKALAATEGEKIKAAIDNDGDWMTEALKGSVQHGDNVVKGKTPEKEQPIKGIDQGVHDALFDKS